jgi:hypothetical protein
MTWCSQYARARKSNRLIYILREDELASMFASLGKPCVSKRHEDYFLALRPVLSQAIFRGLEYDLETLIPSMYEVCLGSPLLLAAAVLVVIAGFPHRSPS